MKQQPTLVERFADNGGHSHWDLIDASNGELLWSGDDELYSDQQNKEKDAEIQRLTTNNKELEEKLMSEQIENGYLQGFRVSNEAEIQRLRELLGRASQYIQVYGMGGDTAKQLLTDIDNGLNPKYNPAYIEGKTDLQNEG